MLFVGFSPLDVFLPRPHWASRTNVFGCAPQPG